MNTAEERHDDAAMDMEEGAYQQTKSTFKNRFFVGNLTIAGDATIKGNTIKYGNETLRGNETIGGNLTVGGNITISGSFGNGTFTDLTLPAAIGGESTAISPGILALGGANTSTTNVSMFEVGARNLFAGNYSIVPNVSGSDNIAIGTNALATTTVNNGIAIGKGAITSGGTFLQGGIAIGSAYSASNGAIASGDVSVAIGSAIECFNGASATGDKSIAIGAGSQAAGDYSAAMGFSSSASNFSSVAIGLNALASGVESIAVGYFASAKQDQSICVGAGTQTSGLQAVAVGSGYGPFAGAKASGIASLALGGSDISGNYIGAIALGARAVAIGSGTNSSNNDNIALGTGAQATVGNGAIAIGSRGNGGGASPIASSYSAIAMGSGGSTGAGAISSGNTAIAIGGGNNTFAGTNAFGLAAVALGGSDGASFPGASATGTRSVAIGCGASIGQNDAILLGNAVNTAVKVAIGIATPTARLHVAGPAGTPVATFNAGDTTAGSQIFFTNVAAGAAVAALSLTAATNGSLQVVGSSERFKENFRSLDVSDKIYELNPCMFDYKKENGGVKNWSGFVAEEVAEVLPDLVNYDAEGIPFSTRDVCFHALAIKELQKHQQRLAYQDIIISQLRDKIEQYEGVTNTLFHRIEQLEVR